MIATDSMSDGHFQHAGIFDIVIWLCTRSIQADNVIMFYITLQLNISLATAVFYVSYYEGACILSQYLDSGWFYTCKHSCVQLAQ